MLTYANPIFFQGRTAKDEVRDPCIVKEGNIWYLVFTVWPFRGRDEAHLHEENEGSSPGIKLYASTDLRNWTFVKWLVKSSELPADCPYKHRFWAPEIHKIGGEFYLIFTADNWIAKHYNPAGTWGAAGYAFVGVADRISGPYEHLTYIQGAACDTTLMGDADGRAYAFIPRGDTYVQEINLGGIHQGKVKLVGEPRKIVTADNSDIGMAAKPDYLEGPWATRIKGRYYLFYAGPYRDNRHAQNLGYWTGVAYADHPMGPWRKDARGQVFWGGHLAVFEGPDGRNWFSYRGEKHPETRGFLCIDPFDVDENGAIQGAGPTITEQSVPIKRR